MTLEKAHAGDVLAQKSGPHQFVAGRCSYCGSITVEDAIRLLSASATAYRVATWLYGWPHKIHLGAAEFHHEHLRDCTDAELDIYNTLMRPLTGIEFVREYSFGGNLRGGDPVREEHLGFFTPVIDHCPAGVVP